MDDYSHKNNNEQLSGKKNVWSFTLVTCYLNSNFIRGTNFQMNSGPLSRGCVQRKKNKNGRTSCEGPKFITGPRNQLSSKKPNILNKGLTERISNYKELSTLKFLILSFRSNCLAGLLLRTWITWNDVESIKNAGKLYTDRHETDRTYDVSIQPGPDELIETIEIPICESSERR